MTQRKYKEQMGKVTSPLPEGEASRGSPCSPLPSPDALFSHCILARGVACRFSSQTNEERESATRPHRVRASPRAQNRKEGLRAAGAAHRRTFQDCFSRLSDWRGCSINM